MVYSNIMVSYHGESLGPVDLTWPVGYDQVKHVVMSCGNANNLCQPNVVDHINEPGISSSGTCSSPLQYCWPRHSLGS